MASSKLLKEAIADAKAVRETAIANAKIALEEAFTPRLQSILSRKLQAEMEGDEEEADMNEDNDTSTGIGTGDNKQPADAANSAQTDLSGISSQSASAGDELEGHEEVDDLMEGEDEEAPAMEGEEEAEYAAEGEEMAPEADEDELDLESIIRELEDELGMEESDELGYEDPTGVENAYEGEEEAPAAEAPAEDEMEAPAMEGEEEETIDLDEILREMGYGDDEEVSEEEEAGNEEEVAAMQSELKEAYSTIQSLRKTINEVNLLNAKLLYVNKLFKAKNLNEAQKVKVINAFDRAETVREAKNVFDTLNESLNTEKAKSQIKESLSFASKSAGVSDRQPIMEGNDFVNRMQKLAGII